MKKLLFLLLLFPGCSLWASMPEQCGEPQAGDCSFYLDCIEEKFECGYIGYPVSYGFKYCKKFKNAKKFSSRGKKWVASTMLCLQQRLVPFMQDSYLPSESSCKSIDNWAFASHAACYTEHENSFCYLGPRDLILAAAIIGPRALVGNHKSRKQIREAAMVCLAKYQGKSIYQGQIDFMNSFLKEDNDGARP